MTKSGVDCGYAHRGAFGLRRGLLLPGVSVHVFKNESAANSAILRTNRSAERLKNSMLDGWDKVQAILLEGRWDVRQTVRVRAKAAAVAVTGNPASGNSP